ncbi:MAG: PEP-CTERM sorting domain-containing protein [Planctomycetes bacterium]|nr:PEP-CTERM sorting domain-containing protein [Planctomycetota bacterium]
MRNRILRWCALAAVALFVNHLGPVAATARGATVIVGGGSLTLNLDGNAIANGADADYLAYFGVNLTPGQTFMEFARHFTPSQAAGLSVLDFRPQPNPPVVNFNDIRAGWVRPSSDGLLYGVNGRDPIGAQPPGRGAESTTFAFDPADITGTATGVIGTTGATSFWYSNQAMIDTGSVWLGFGDLTLQYDASRFVSGGTSGWYLTNNLLFPATLFDTTNVSVGFTGGVFTLSGDLVVSPEFHDAWGFQDGLNVGSFQLTSYAVPEPSSIVMFVGGMAVAFVFAGGRRLSRTA